MKAGDTIVFERDDRLYMVAAVAPFDLAENEVADLAFAEDLRKMSPNDHLLWLRGQYVEADKPNLNGQMWTAGDLEIASLTPNLMPVTVMHDPRTAVGLIADTKMLTPAKDDLPRARIDTTLAVWQHRFPDIADEIAVNYSKGELMQSMEGKPRWYECLECGHRVPKLPDGAEAAGWCEHFEAKRIGDGVDAANTIAARRLGQVTFTGTGLIFGSRGARGAYEEATLEVQEEIAEFHERAQRPSRTKPRRSRSMDTIEIPRTEYDDLKKKGERVDEAEAKVSGLEESAGKVPDLERQVETAEAAKVKAEGERDDLKKKVDEAEETARATELSTERRGKLGKGFTEKLGDFTRGRLEEQAGALSDEEWENRLKELEETSGVKRDAESESGEESGGSSEDDETLSREETARSALGGGDPGKNGQGPSSEERQSVIGGLFAPTSTKGD